VKINGKQEGTAFPIITAAHVVMGTEPSQITMTPYLFDGTHTVEAVATVPGLDIALLYPDQSIHKEGYVLNDIRTKFGTSVSVPNFAKFNLVKLKDKAIPSTGRIIGYDELSILFTLDVVQKGSSGAPILDQYGHVVGLLTNRVIHESEYSGVCYGIEAGAIQDYLHSITNDE
jgi:S1-C subfamily serine protease